MKQDKMARRTAPLALALALASMAFVACTTSPTITARSDPSANLSSYRTYGFPATTGTDRAGLTTPVTNYFKEAIRTEMNARGYVFAENNPDLLVNFSANVRENVDIQSYGGSYPGYYGYRGGMYGGGVYGGSDIATVRYKVGTANVDVVDAARKQIVWEGIAEGQLNESRMKDPQSAVARVIKMMFEKYPKPVVAPPAGS